MNETNEDYEALLLRLRRIRPRLSKNLLAAEERRRHTVRMLLDGARFKGLEELLTHLDALESACSSDQALASVAFLIRRAKSNFETAIEAILSGYVSVAIDAMRDVIEIENLLLDFSANQTNMAEWLDGKPDVLRKRFRPIDVRRRLRDSGIGHVGDRAESLDYAAHSASLHVSPHQHPIGKKGMSGGDDLFGDDAGFWELFEHARRLLGAADLLRNRSGSHSLKELPRYEQLESVKDAWERTQEMQAMFLAMWTAAAETIEVESNE